LIRGGANIYPREIEEVLYQHPKVRDAAVVGVPDPRLGERVLRLRGAARGRDAELRRDGRLPCGRRSPPTSFRNSCSCWRICRAQPTGNSEGRRSATSPWSGCGESRRGNPEPRCGRRDFRPAAWTGAEGGNEDELLASSDASRVVRRARRVRRSVAERGVAEEGVTKDSILIGGYGPITGPAAYVGLGGRDGAELALQEINDAGGINAGSYSSSSRMMRSRRARRLPP